MSNIFHIAEYILIAGIDGLDEDHDVTEESPLGMQTGKFEV